MGESRYQKQALREQLKMEMQTLISEKKNGLNMSGVKKVRTLSGKQKIN